MRWHHDSVRGRIGWRGLMLAIVLVLCVTYRGNLCTGSHPDHEVDTIGSDH